MRESIIESSVIRYAKNNGFTAIKLRDMSHKGAPDRLLLYRGTAFFIEFKAPGKKLRPEQLRYKAVLEAQGFSVYRVDNIAAGIDIIKRYIYG